MGWMSHRNATTSRPTSPMKGRRHKGPLRNIVKVLHSWGDLYTADKVLLSCGHEGRSWGGVQARCRKCADESAPKGGG